MIISELLVFAAMALGLLPLALLILWVWWDRKTDKRRSPLTSVLHNLPGQQAQQQADRLMEAAGSRLLMATLVGPLALAGWAVQKLDKQLLRFGLSEAIILCSSSRSMAGRRGRPANGFGSAVIISMVSRRSARPPKPWRP
jgi:hypothetical protein